MFSQPESSFLFKNGSDQTPIPLFADITREAGWRTMEGLRKEGLTDLEIGQMILEATATNPILHANSGDSPSATVCRRYKLRAKPTSHGPGGFEYDQRIVGHGLGCAGGRTAPIFIQL